MPLYTIASVRNLPFIHRPEGLHITESDNALLLSIPGNTTVENVRKRMVNDHSAFVAYLYNQRTTFGWMARGKATIGDLAQSFILPEGNQYLWNFRTLADCRGLRIYPAFLEHIIRYEAGEAVLDHPCTGK